MPRLNNLGGALNADTLHATGALHVGHGHKLNACNTHTHTHLQLQHGASGMGHGAWGMIMTTAVAESRLKLLAALQPRVNI